jgi:hypothetical protein
MLPWLMLVSRSVLFFLFQALFAALFLLSGNQLGWQEAPRWWPFVVSLTNLASVSLLVLCMRAEGKRYFDVFHFSRATIKTDLLWLLGLSVIGLPIAAAPMNTLAAAIFGDAMAPVHLMFSPLPAWALVHSFLFPLTIAFAELPTYFGYAMPRLAEQLHSSWTAWLLASFALAAQHMFLPFIPDSRFMLWRIGMYLPFALFAGLVLKLRPQLLPYMVIVHAMMDISTVAVYWMV